MVSQKKQNEGVGGHSDATTAKPASRDLSGTDRPATAPPEDLVPRRTRTASLFVSAAVGLVLALLMLVFVLQNGDRQRLEFLWFDFTLPVGAAMLLAAIVGGLIVASLGLGRVVQLRLAARRRRRGNSNCD